MTENDVPDQTVAGLDVGVADRIVTELGPDAGERVLRCLRTAQSLLRLSSEDEADLRLAESAAYNLREALNSVVKGKPAGESGFAAALEAWEQYKITSSLPGADEPAARAELAASLDSLARDKEHHAYMTSRLLEWFRAQSGLEPIPGDGDPTMHYQRLRDGASRILHGNSTHAEVEILFGEAVAWFVRFFTPPSDIVGQLVALAKRPYSPALLAKLRAIALNAHHLRLFLERLDDPAWLDPIRECGLIGLPRPGKLWPVDSLIREPRRLPDEAVTGLLQSLLGDVKTLPKAERAASAREIMRTASWLGPAGHGLVLDILRRYPADDLTQTIAISVAKSIDATDPFHVAVADAVIGNEPRRDHGHRTRTVLANLVEGMTKDNVSDRFELIVVKIRRLAIEARSHYLFLDIAALQIERPDQREPLSFAAQCLATVVPKARLLGLSGATMLRLIERIPGELGERLTCQILAGAADIDRSIKLAHLDRRLASNTATGDDRALLADLEPLSDSEIQHLRNAFGTPSPAANSDDVTALPDDWAKAWRWSMILPEGVLDGWEEPIAAVAHVHGTPDTASLDRPTSNFQASFGSSPYPTEELAALDILEAAAVVAKWRPTADTDWGVSARQLARSLEAVVKDQTAAWVRDPVAIVRALREPVYVNHFFRAVAANAKAAASRAPEVLQAVKLVHHERWEPTVLGNDDFDYDPEWSVVDKVSVELIRALADADADLDADLALCWQLAIDAARDIPEDLGSIEAYSDASGYNDPLNQAINSSYGTGLQAVLALGGWEHRQKGAAGAQLITVLTEVTRLGGAVGLALRSIIAASRPFVEAIAPDWMSQNYDVIFGDELGQVTFEQTLKYSRPTRVLYDRSLRQLVAAARRGAENAVAWLLIAHLWDEPDYTFDRIIGGLIGQPDALQEVGHEIARLSGDVPAEQPDLMQRGVAFSERLLSETRDRVPGSTLRGLGRWALARNLDPATWLELTERTLALTGGPIDYPTEVAERCRDLQPSTVGLRILTELIGHGDRWEQHHVETVSAEALRAAADTALSDTSWNQLRERLIQRGRHDAAAVESTRTT